MIDKIYFSKVRENAKIPSKAKEDAGYDIYLCFDEDYIIIPAHETKMISTGIASALPENYYFQIQERGSTGSLGIKYSAGVIDSSYRGEWLLAITNSTNRPLVILKDSSKMDLKYLSILNKIAVVYPYEKALFQAIIHSVHNELQTQELSYEALQNIKSNRGDGKLGSTGK